MVSRYYSLCDAPTALGANAMYWSWWHGAWQHDKPGMLWVFPPFPLRGCVLNKLLYEQVNTVNAILILPRFMPYWTAMLQQLPVGASHEIGQAVHYWF